MTADYSTINALKMAEGVIASILDRGLGNDGIKNVHNHITEVIAKAEQASEMEAEIAAFFQDLIESGNFNPEEAADRLARYGLKDPVDFAAEMQERMGLEVEADEDEAPAPTPR